VGQVNAALQSIGARIESTLPAASAMTIAVAPPQDLSTLVALADILNQSPGINRALPAQVLARKVLPPGPAGQPTNRFQIAHLLPTRFPAAWNAGRLATNNCIAKGLTIVIGDLFSATLTAAPDFQNEVPGFTPVGTNGSPTNETHGVEVTTTLAASFNSKNPTGANPFSSCLFIEGIDIGRLSQDEALGMLSTNFPAGKFILNCSWGFVDECLNPTNCKFSDFVGVVTSPLQRAYKTAVWKKLTASRWNDFLVCAATGEARDTMSAQIYFGLDVAQFSSPITIATGTDPFFGFVSQGGFWNPAPAFPFLPTTASSTEVAALRRYILTNGLSTIGPAQNVLTVGSAKTNSLINTIQESDFTTFGADVYAVGEDIFMLDGTLDEGTSFASPQVTGLASYLWLLSDDLRNAPVTMTKQAILENARTVPQTNFDDAKVLDAYAAALSLDQAVLPTKATAPVRLAIVDVNNNGEFNENDLQMFVTNYVVNGVPVEPASRDYGRFDLNGDGFTGGSGTERFDLDRLGSEQFGFTLYDLSVTQSVEGLPITYSENAASDLDVLCYCAYSGLYTGDTNTRSALIGDLCTAKVAVRVFGRGTVLTGESGQFVAGVSGIADQRVIWSVIPPSAGTITTDGLFTAGCPTNLNTGQSATIRATSVLASNRFGDATVAIQYPVHLRLHEPGNPLVVEPFTLFLGDCSVIQIGGLPTPLTDFHFRVGCGSNDVLGALTSACGAGASFDLAMDAFPSTDTSINETHQAGWEVRAGFTAPVATTVTTSFGNDWTGDATRVGATKQVSVLFNGGPVANAQAIFAVNNGVVTQNTPLPPFQIPKGTNIDINLDATCFGGCSGGGRAVTITFTPASPTGIFKLIPAVETVSLHELLLYAFSWTVPEAFNWHHLRDLQLRIRDENDLVLWLRFNEADRTFSLLNELTGRFGPAAAAGNNRHLETPSAILNLAQTSVVASGPTSPTVTLNLGLSFKPSAAGRTFIVEVAASDDDGNTDDFIEAGVLTIAP
jgi:hypothetical protein